MTLMFNKMEDNLNFEKNANLNKSPPDLNLA